MDCSQPGSSVHGILQAKNFSGLPFPPGNLPTPGIKPMSPVSPALQADSLPTEPQGKPKIIERLITVEMVTHIYGYIIVV